MDEHVFREIMLNAYLACENTDSLADIEFDFDDGYDEDEDLVEDPSKSEFERLREKKRYQEDGKIAELAADVVGFMLGRTGNDYMQEEKKSSPDPERLAELDKHLEELSTELRGVKDGKMDTVESCINKYATICREYFSR